MLIEFQVENFRSYRDKRSISMVASGIKERPENCLPVESLGLNLLRSEAIYGANASGKSNLLQAAYFLANLMRLHKDTFLLDEREDPAPFLLDPDRAESPSCFTVDFVCHEVRYEYFIGIRSGRVKEEWLNVYPKQGRKQEWFARESSKSHADRFVFNTTYLKGAKKRLGDMTRPDISFLALAAALNHPQLSVPAQWIASNFCIPSIHQELRVAHRSYSSTAKLCYDDPVFRSRVIHFLRHANLGICDVQIEESEQLKGYRQHAPSSSPSASIRKETVYVYDAYFLHQSGGNEQDPIRFPFRDESEGTKRLFLLLAPWYEVLQNGRLILIDELGTSIHPLMTRRLIQLFHDSEINSKGAQLILTTHDTSLLTEGLFRRDQIWFTEKDPKGATDLYSLHDFHPREEHALEKNYLRGRYGAIPFFGKLEF